MNDFRDYIAHYGIKGMHWGVRRYQNPDGTLTEKGKLRAQKEKDKEIRDLNDYYDKQIRKTQASDKFYNSKLMQNYAHKRSKLNRNERTRAAIEKIRQKEIDIVKNTDWKDLVDIRKTQGAKQVASHLKSILHMQMFNFASFHFYPKNFSTNEERYNIAKETSKDTFQQQYIYRRLARFK